MLHDAHTRKISEKVIAHVGDTIVIPAKTDAWIYVHELIGDLASAGTLQILAGSRVQGFFSLDAGQGITIQDEPGEDGRPRFECKPGEDFILRVTGGSFNGSMHYSIRY